MAAQPSAPAQGAWSFDLVGHLKRRFGIGAQNWDRFAAAADSGDVRTAVPPPSGAHVTLKDLARDASSISALPPNDDPAVRAAIEDDSGWVGTPDPTKYAAGTADLPPRELKEEIEKGNIMMWKDFKQAVSELNDEERGALLELVKQRLLQERYFITLKDGSKVSLWDLYEYVENNPELQTMYERRRNFPMANPDDPAGRPLPSQPVSGLDRSAGLPEAVMAPQEAEELGLDWGHVGRGCLWRRRPTRWLRGIDGVKDWDVEVYAHEPMANQILGRQYGGRDPYEVVKDPSYARDVLRCGPLLGMTFVLTAARDLPLQDLASSWRDMLSTYLQRQAPLSVPRRLRPYVLDTSDLNGVTWPRLFLEPPSQQQPQPPAPAAASSATAGDEAADGDDGLGVSWRQMGREEHERSVQAGMRLLQSLPEALCPDAEPSTWPLSETPLVDGTKRNWRQGGSLWVTLEPEGGVVFQAQSAGLVGEQESYLLARVSGQEALSGAVMDAFLGPQPLDPHMAATTRSLLLMPANGFLAGNRNQDPNHPMFSEPVQRLPKVPADPSAFRLVSRSQMERLQPGQCGTVLSGIREFGVANEFRSLLVRAYTAATAELGEEASPSDSRSAAAADAASNGSEARQQRAREAAMRVLREGLVAMGPEARSLIRRVVVTATSPAGDVLLPELRGAHQGPDDQFATDLFSLARSFGASSEGEQDCA
ncbi:hypothetical protein PLESTB_000008200 [Pleodorina starrii]|uniref:Uncharacterized protein n=1 Tax=Pleodorina starrii TaxID=330485 RepID=A0A9W6EV95_9CHLO|nr:hypothetical protein PLESTM_000839000 [Pleodorina starrii]GLC47623.1 hypothetical protein PLESTB_000008200 [Pleodorina starrii]GLC75631.1 hypothetical protein PLESTF_001667200 [Pleodorina starrii]